MMFLYGGAEKGSTKNNINIIMCAMHALARDAVGVYACGPPQRQICAAAGDILWHFSAHTFFAKHTDMQTSIVTNMTHRE